MLYIIIGALFLGAVAKMGVEKVSDVSNSVKTNGLKETMTNEIKNTAEFVGDSLKSEYKSLVREAERREREQERKNKV